LHAAMAQQRAVCVHSMCHALCAAQHAACDHGSSCCETKPTHAAHASATHAARQTRPPAA
jgi:hypothetical protein